MDRAGGVATSALNRPARRNALDIAMRERFGELVAQAIDDSEVQAIVLTGTGGHFCAGGDVTSMQPRVAIEAEAGLRRMRDGLRTAERLYQCDKPVVAAVEGCAYGGGVGLALLADLVVVSETARFCLSSSKIGLVPDGAVLYTLPRIVGVQRAKEMVFSTREIDATTARCWGIALEVVPEGGALGRAQEIARALAAASGAALGMAKVALNQSLSSSLPLMMEYEAAAQGVAFSTRYHQDAIRRFVGKESLAFQWPSGSRATTSKG